MHPARIARSCGMNASCGGAGVPERPTLSLPDGQPPCQGSGPAAACAATLEPGAIASGAASTPAGSAACPVMASKPVPANPATCSDVILAPDRPMSRSTLADRPSVRPSVPVDSLGSERPNVLMLSSDADSVLAGRSALLTATADQTVTGTGWAIEIFDLTSGTLVAACSEGSQCSVAYSASGRHEFSSFVTSPTDTIPDGAVAMQSNQVIVEWLGAGITVNQIVAGPGKPFTVTATSTVDVEGTGRRIEIYDLTSGSRVTYCSRGTRCMTTMTQTRGGVRRILAYVSGEPGAVSPPITLTWLKVSLSATSIGPKAGGTVHLKATVNVDLRGSGWAVAVYDQNSRLVGQLCKTGTACNVQAVMDGTS